MSIPIPICLYSKAAAGDEEAFGRLVAAMRVNVKHRAWSQWPCPHDPKCPKPTDAQWEVLQTRLAAALERKP